VEWFEKASEYIRNIKPVEMDSVLLQQIFQLIDLTSLNDNDTNTSIAALLNKAQSSFGHVAAVCIYSKFVRLVANELLSTTIKIATVVNFPEGNNSLDNVLIEINNALENGAQEIDVVFPYSRYLAGERQYAQTFISTCKAACGNNVSLKVILETGALQDTAIIADASYDALTSGADFIKTSTGKIAIGATLEAATVMLLVIHHLGDAQKGLKISGGLRSIADVIPYLQIAKQIMGEHWINKDHFRIGSSRLVDDIGKAI